MNRVVSEGVPPNPGAMAEAFRAVSLGAAQEAAQAAADAMRAGAPGGFAGDDVRGTARKTPDGYVIRAAPVPAKRHVARWVTGGTGVFGPRHKPITRHAIDPRTGRPRPFFFNGRAVAEIEGQHPNPFIERNRPAADTAVATVLRAAGDRAMQALRARL